MSEDSQKPVELEEAEAVVLLQVLRAPGWAAGLEAIGDGLSALRRLRAAIDVAGLAQRPAVAEHPLPAIAFTAYEMTALQAATLHAANQGVFGLADDLDTFFAKVGVKIPTRQKE